MLYLQDFATSTFVPLSCVRRLRRSTRPSLWLYRDMHRKEKYRKFRCFLILDRGPRTNNRTTRSHFFPDKYLSFHQGKPPQTRDHGLSFTESLHWLARILVRVHPDRLRQIYKRTYHEELNVKREHEIALERQKRVERR